MPRCVLTATLAAALLAPASTLAQRNFPQQALRGELLILQPPEALLNGQPVRLAPGARIRGQDNMLLMSGALVDQKLAVHYTLDYAGLVFDIWMLTPAEFANRPWPTTPAQSKAWVFDPAAQTWSRP